MRRAAAASSSGQRSGLAPRGSVDRDWRRVADRVEQRGAVLVETDRQPDVAEPVVGAQLGNESVQLA